MVISKFKKGDLVLIPTTDLIFKSQNIKAFPLAIITDVDSKINGKPWYSFKFVLYLEPHGFHTGYDYEDKADTTWILITNETNMNLKTLEVLYGCK